MPLNYLSYCSVYTHINYPTKPGYIFWSIAFHHCPILGEVLCYFSHQTSVHPRYEEDLVDMQHRNIRSCSMGPIGNNYNIS